MWSGIRRHLSYANVTATLALVFAMSGGAMAAKHYLINSTGQINPKVLKTLRGRTGRPGLTGIEGPSGPAGAPGPSGPVVGSKAFNSNSLEVDLWFPLVSEQRMTVASLSLPAGNFSVFGKLIANNAGGFPPGSPPIVRCELLLGGTVIDPGYSGLALGGGGPGADTNRHTVALSGIGSLSSPGTAEIICKVNDVYGKYQGRSITAIQVGSLGP
jgi:hypothetical protein